MEELIMFKDLPKSGKIALFEAWLDGKPIVSGYLSGALAPDNNPCWLPNRVYKVADYKTPEVGSVYRDSVGDLYLCLRILPNKNDIHGTTVEFMDRESCSRIETISLWDEDLKQIDMTSTEFFSEDLTFKK